jgi:hypothetical protein
MKKIMNSISKQILIHIIFKCITLINLQIQIVHSRYQPYQFFTISYLHDHS